MTVPLCVLGVFAHVGERLGHDEVHVGLDLRAKAVARDGDRQRQPQPVDQLLDGDGEAVAGEGARQDPVRQLAEIGVGLLGQSGGLGVQLPGPLGVAGVACAFGQREREGDLDQAVLRTVVQVADDPPPRLVGGGDDAGARRGELLGGLILAALPPEDDEGG